MLQNYKSEFRSIKILNDSSRWINVLNVVVPILLAGIQCVFQSCKKLVEISPPAATVVTSQAFSTDELATSAMEGVYSKMINANGDNFSNGSITIYSGASADELNFFTQSNTDNFQFQSNNLTGNNSKLANSFWSNGYSILYAANSVIDGLTNSTNIHDSVKAELLGEAKFVRAFCNFYLCNLFGPIPLVTEINWRKNQTLSRIELPVVYQQIISDLKDAQTFLSNDYSVGHGQKIIPNRWAATALLARVYLYHGDWAAAESLATSVISNPAFALNSSLNDVFKINSTEAIWQLQQANTLSPTYNSTNEGTRIIPLNATSSPFVYLTDTLRNSFSAIDKRRIAWIDSTKFSSKFYYYPKKYKVGPAQRTANGSYSEYYMVLRLAEQYLIRSEARAKQGNLTGAITDINIIRNRASVPLLPNNLSEQQVISAIEVENKLEFFAEWAHRWFDLKRWKRADTVLGGIKGSNWQTTDQLYPIPNGELSTDPNLIQNDGYL